MEFIKLNGVLCNTCLFEAINRIRNLELTILGDIEHTDFYVTENVKFSGDIWDFSIANKHGRNNADYIFDFSDFSMRYKIYAKRMIIYILFNREKGYRTVKGQFSIIKNFTNYLNHNLIWHGEAINLKLIEDYFDIKCGNLSDSTKIQYLSSIRDFLSEIESSHSKLDFIEIYEFINKIITECSESNNYGDSNKTDMIPINTYYKTVSLALKDIRNNELSIKERMVACLIVILAETGMRVEELSLIEKNKLDEIKLNSGEEVSYLNFKTFKTVRTIEEALDTETFMAEKAKYAYNALSEFVDKIIDNLDESKRLRLILLLDSGESFGYDTRITLLREKVSQISQQRITELNKLIKKFVYINPLNGRKYNNGKAVFECDLIRFYIRHQKEFEFDKMPYEDLLKMKIHTIDSESKYNQYHATFNGDSNDFEEYKGLEFYYASPHMFRVTVCTLLIKREVPLDVVMKHMNHLSVDMTQHYNRSEEFRDALSDSIKVLSYIGTKAGLLEINPENVENESIKKDLIDPENREDYILINEFLKRNKLNIVKDVDKIINLVKRANSPIFENDFGVCVKSALHGICHRQVYFSNSDDYYYLGIKIPTLKNLHFTYNRFLEKVKLIKYNESVVKEQPQYQTELNREKRALQLFIEKLLLPELEIAKEKLIDLGEETFVKEYPHLKSISYKIEEIINNEVMIWMA